MMSMFQAGHVYTLNMQVLHTSFNHGWRGTEKVGTWTLRLQQLDTFDTVTSNAFLHPTLYTFFERSAIVWEALVGVSVAEIPPKPRAWMRFALTTLMTAREGA